LEGVAKLSGGSVYICNYIEYSTKSVQLYYLCNIIHYVFP